MHPNQVDRNDMEALDVDCRHARTFRFEPPRTALIVIDMQVDFLSATGYIAATAGHQGAARLRSICDNVKRLLGAARQTGMHVVLTREGYSPDGSDVTPFKASLGYVGASGPNGPFLIRGTPGHDFHDGFHPAPGEVVIDKAGFSAFYNTRLQATLEDWGVTHLLLTGVTTQCCVHSTLRDAVERGYFCLTVEDACAAESDRWHSAAIELIESEGNLFGSITTTKHVEIALQQLSHGG